MPTVDEVVLSGHPDVYSIAYASGNDPVTANGVSWTGWTQFLGTEDGAELSIGLDTEYLEKRVNEARGPVGLDLVKDGLSGSFSVVETALARLESLFAGSIYAAGATPGTDPNTFDLGGLTADGYFSLGMEVVGAEGGTFVIFISKMKFTSAPKLIMAKGGIRKISVDWIAVEDPNQAAGKKYGTWYELTVA